MDMQNANTKFALVAFDDVAKANVILSIERNAAYSMQMDAIRTKFAVNKSRQSTLDAKSTHRSLIRRCKDSVERAYTHLCDAGKPGLYFDFVVLSFCGLTVRVDLTHRGHLFFCLVLKCRRSCYVRRETTSKDDVTQRF